MRLASRQATRFAYTSSVSAPDSPTYLPRMNRTRPTGLDNTASAVPLRISRATDDEALSTAPNKPVTSITASVLVLTI